MNTNQSMERSVREFLLLFHSREIDFEKAASYFSDDALYQAHVPAVDALCGRDRIKAELERQLQLYSECDFQIINIGFGPDQVFVERRDTVTQALNGARVLVRVNAIFEFDKNGKICHWREYWDLGDVQRQVGISEQQMLELMEQ